MAFPEKQNLFVPFGGLRTDVDDKLLPLGSALEIENAYVMRRGAGEGTVELIKRFGTTQLAAPGNTQGQLGTHLGALVNVGTLLTTLATATSTACVPVANSDMRPSITASLTKVSGDALTPDVAYGGGYYWIMYQAATNIGAPDKLVAVAIDEATGHRAWETTFLPSGGGSTSFSSWRVNYVSGRATFIYMELDGSIHCMAVNPTAFTTVSTATAAAVGIGGPYFLGWFDTVTRANFVAVAYPNPALGLRALDYDVLANTITQWTPNDAAAAAIPLDGALGWIQDFGGSGKIALATASAAQGLKVQWAFATAGATRQATATHVIDAAFGGAGSYIAGHTTASSALGEYVIAYDTGATPNRRILRATRIGGVVSPGGLVARGVRLRSKTWTYGGDNFLVGQFESATQGTHYVLRIPYGPSFATPTPLCKIGVRSSTVAGLNRMSTVVSPRAGQFTFAMFYTPRFDTVPNPDSYGVELATVTHPALPYSSIGPPKEAIGSLFAPGGTVGQFDGATFAEAGFAYSPEVPTAITPAAGAGAMTPAVTYWYVYTYVRTDAQGRIWRSAPSIPTSVVMGGGDNQTSAPIPTLRLTGRSDIKIEVWRGAANDDVTYQKAGVVPNDVTVDTVTFTDTMSDINLETMEVLYTVGGVLDNDTPPGFSSVTEAQNRTWGPSADDTQALWYSKEHVLGTGLEFSEALVLDVRDQHGPIRTCAQIDGRPIAFKTDAVYAVGGAGPDVLGAGGSYSAQAVCVGIGCSNAQAVCETKDGIIFLSTSQRSGFFLLDRSLSVTPIGAPVQRYIGETITASVFLSSLLQARFYTASGRTLVYDLVTGTWTTFTGQPANTAVAWNGLATYVSSATGHMLVEDVSGLTLTDDGAAYTMLAGLPYVQVNQVKGYERFWRLEPVGEVARGSVTVRMRLYEGTDAVPLSAREKVCGAGQLDAVLRRSDKLSGLRVVVDDRASTTGILKLSGVTLVLGVKAGLRPRPDSSRMT
jgi:hypothetical protein